MNKMRYLLFVLMLLIGCGKEQIDNYVKNTAESYTYNVKCYKDGLIFNGEGFDDWEISYSPIGYVFYRDHLSTIITSASCIIETKIRIEK